MLEDPEVERALVVMAHPDDVDFGAAGTVALWNRAGISVTYGIVTDGDAGGFDPAIPRGEIPGIRQREQRASAAVVGERCSLPDTRTVTSPSVTFGHQSADSTGSSPTHAHSVTRSEGAHPRIAPDHGGRGGCHPSRLSRCPQPLRLPDVAQDEGLEDWVVPAY